MGDKYIVKDFRTTDIEGLTTFLNGLSHITDKLYAVVPYSTIMGVSYIRVIIGPKE